MRTGTAGGFRLALPGGGGGAARRGVEAREGAEEAESKEPREEAVERAGETGEEGACGWKEGEGGNEELGGEVGERTWISGGARRRAEVGAGEGVRVEKDGSSEPGSSYSGVSWSSRCCALDSDPVPWGTRGDDAPRESAEKLVVVGSTLNEPARNRGRDASG